MTGYFIQAFIYLCAVTVAVPVAKRLGLGSVLGYLIAGIAIGPALGLVGQETVTIQHFAEFGVVMMLFVVGLELEPRSLWAMRNRLFGLGGLQLVLTTAVVTIVALAVGQPWRIALAIGLIFSLSSTAIVLQTFAEKGLSKTEGGRNAFSVLLFQDIAVIPILALIPLLASPELTEQMQHLAASGDHHDSPSLVAHMAPWARALVVMSTIFGLIAGGHLLGRPLFRYVAGSGLREVFTAAALMLVIGIAALMGLVGLSPALGAFLAGVVLANSEFRHELEASIEPFKGLLLGLFFITVGAGINFAVLQNHLVAILAMTAGLMLIKALVLLVLGIVFKIKGSNRWLFTLSLAQAGEFGFVLLSFTTQNSVLPDSISQILSPVVALSMVLTPALFIFFDKVIVPRHRQSNEEKPADDIEEMGTVIIAGIGRFGQIINRLLVANGIKTVVLDHQPGQVELMRRINIKSYFGDACRPALLHTAGIEQADLLVVAIDDRQRSTELVTYVKKHYPRLRVLTRAFDRAHLYELRYAGADIMISETYHSALEMGREALISLGVHPFRAQQMKYVFAETEEAESDRLFESWRDAEESRAFTQHYRELFMELEKVLSKAMKRDRTDKHSKSERGWTPPPKQYIKDFESQGSSSGE